MSLDVFLAYIISLRLKIWLACEIYDLIGKSRNLSYEFG